MVHPAMAFHISKRISNNRLVLLIALATLAIATSSAADDNLANARNIQAENWAASVRRSYQPITDGVIEANVQKVLKAIQVARPVLDGMPNGGVLIRETKLNELQSDLTLRIYDVEHLQSILGFLSRSMPNEAEKVMDDISTVLRRLIGKLEWMAISDSQAMFNDCIEQLKYAILAGRLDEENSEAVRDAYEWLAKSGMIDVNLAGARSVLSHPNEYIRLRREFVQNMIPNAITKSVPVSQSLDKVHITARVDVAGKVCIEFVPNTEEAVFHVHADGTAKIPLTLSHKLADIKAYNNLNFAATIGLHVPARDFELGSHEIKVDSHSQLQAVCLHLRLRVMSKALTPLASRVIVRLLPKVDAKVEEKLKSEIESQLNDSGYAALTQLNGLLNRVFWKTMESRSVDSQTHSSTTSNEFLRTEEVILPTTLAAPSKPSGFGELNPPLQMQLHESALNNVSVSLARRTYNEVVFRELVFGSFGLHSDVEPFERGGRIPAAFTFADKGVLNAKFDDSRIEFRIRIKAFEWEGKLYEGSERTATVVYDVQLDDKQITLVQPAPIRIEPVAENNVILGMVLERFFAPKAFLKRTFRESDSTKIGIVHFTVDDGWLQAGVDQQPKQPSFDPSPAVSITKAE